MPETVKSETPERRVMRQWFQGKLAERLLQAGQMAKDRELLRRGAAKQQDGTLGTEQSASSTLDEQMNIRVGDEQHYYQISAEPATKVLEPATTVPVQPAGGLTSTLGKAALAAALLGSGVGLGVGIPWLAEAFNQEQPATAPMDFEDTTARVIIE